MEDLDLEIRKNRISNPTVTVTHNGTPVSGQDILLSQVNHKFLFGSNWGETSIALANAELSGLEKEQTKLRNEKFLQIFNQVTLPFYWARFEPQKGHPDTQRIRNAARWYSDHNCVVKGHPLCWHTLTADWLLQLNNRDILKAQVERIQRDVSNFAGLIDMWDVVNEAVIMPIFDRYDNGITRLCKQLGRIELIRAMFEATRSANPKATLLLNDFDVSPAYNILIEGCLAAGVKIDVIGIQTHMHQGYWGVDRTREVLDRFSRFNLPLHFTENTIVSGRLMPPEIVDLNDYQVNDWPSTPEGEARQSEEVVLHYKTLLAHPSVQAITWWDLTDGGWLNAPAGLLRKDQSSKPAYDALVKLIKGEWWFPPTKITTDMNGQFTFEGFPGEYEITLANQRSTFMLNEKGKTSISINL